MSQTPFKTHWIHPPPFLQLHGARYWFAIVGLAVLGLWLRIWGLQAHHPVLFEGHEANYLVYFEHSQFPNVGDTACYPAMQWWWYLWGFVLPQTELTALYLSVATGVSSIVLLSETLRSLSQQSWASIMLAFLLCTHPLHVAWSTSIYNVMPPFAVMALGLFSLVHAGHRSWFAICVSGLCLGLAVSMRIEVGVFGAVFAGIGFYRGHRLSRLGVLFLLSGTLVFALTGQTLLGNELPGSGEHGLAFGMNWGMDEFWAPYSAWLITALWGVGLSFCHRSHIRLWMGSLLFLLFYHLFMSTFNDYGSRHVLPALMILLSGCALIRPWWLPLLLGLGLHLPALYELSTRYHAEPEAYSAFVKIEYSELSEVTAKPDACAMINENPPFASDPLYSHFNVWNTAEFDQISADFGCVNWCMDVHDWRWSSLGIHDRASRIQHLYRAEPQQILNIDGERCVLFRLHR